MPRAILSRPGRRRPAQRPSLEPLESRMVPRAFGVSAALTRQVILNSLNLGVISGQVTNDLNGRGLGNVRVQLINSEGQVQRTVATNPGGSYRFIARQGEP